MAELEHGGVGGEQIARCRPSPGDHRVKRRSEIASPPAPDRPAGPAYLSRNAISAARVPVATACSSCPCEQLEVHVPDPGHVPPVGDPVVERHQQRAWAARRGSACARTSLAPAGFLTNSSTASRPSSVNPLEPPEGGVELLQTRPRSARATTTPVAQAARPQPPRCRRCRGRAPATAPARPQRGDQLERGRPRGPRSRPPLAPRRAAAGAVAVGAAPVAQVAQVDRRIVEPLPAARRTTWSRRRVPCRPVPPPDRRCQSRSRGLPGIERRHQRIVDVSHQRAIRAESRGQLVPALGDRLQLAVAVELVAKQVAQAPSPSARARGRRRGGQPRRPRTGRRRPRLARAAPTPHPRPGSHLPDCDSAGTVAPASRPACAWWWSCRWSPTPPPIRAPSCRSGERSPRNQAPAAAGPGASCRRRCG